MKLSYVNCSDLMYTHRPERKHVDCVDLDPYGTAAPFIDAAVQCVNDGGSSFFCLTCLGSFEEHTTVTDGTSRCVTRFNVRNMYRHAGARDKQLPRKMVTEFHSITSLLYGIDRA